MQTMKHSWPRIVASWALALTGYACAQDRLAAPAQQASTPSATAACAVAAVRRHRAPTYPFGMIDSNTTGTVVVALIADGCGQVTSAHVRTSSGHKAFDDAAVDAASHWVLSAAERADSIDGIVTLPVEFKMASSSQTPLQPDWPRTHRHVRWLLNETTGDYPSAAAAQDAITAMPGASWRIGPYRIPGSGFIQLETPAGIEFWYVIDTIDKDQKTIVAAHYQPVYDNGEPLVRLSVFCDVQPSQCAAFQKLFMKGMDYARPK